MKITLSGSLRGTAITAECISGLKPKTRDPAFARLASALRYEAKRAALGFVVDEVTGVPEGKPYGPYGSHHEMRLRTDAAYRAKYAAAMFATADDAQARGELGGFAEVDEPAARVAETHTLHAICIETPYSLGGPFTAADLARRVADAFNVLRDDWTPKCSGIAESWEQPLSVSAFFEQIGFDPHRAQKHLTGFSFEPIRDADKRRRSLRNLNKEYRARGKLREACRHDPAEFGRLVKERLVDDLVMNGDELATEALDLIMSPESDPGLEVFRRLVIVYGKAGKPFPYTELYFCPLAERLGAEGYQLPRVRTPSRIPGAVIGERAACDEYGLALDELDAAISDGSKPIIRRRGIVIALRKKELPKHSAKPTSSAVRIISTRVVDNSAANDNERAAKRVAA